jgi:hypothetical protein
MAKLVKYELTESGWTQKTLKVIKDSKVAKGEADKLNNSRDDQETTAMVSYVAIG